MLLDNSGSMLDMAYINERGNETQCFDDTFNTVTTYVAVY